ncbi:energy transducer TonB [Sphingobacterium sp. SRCM116780]|uniref:energy transducer TonB n=1 Tax=Sphingobacterium sp. SRCM116780 TaxID=2907623 RepID=UPI001F289648|nr:energy transducer TonB [Sphingobacterium sp. SRCM116780]UIR54809.1 energy transducer TonB [Sphingobacterium sp. SRCM116780]
MTLFAKLLFSIVLLFPIGKIAIAQQVTTTYHKKNGDSLSTLESSYFYRNMYVDTTINGKSIYRVEEYYSEGNNAKTYGYSSTDKTPLRFVGELQTFYPNQNIESFGEYDISGLQIDSAYYFYPNRQLKLVVYRDMEHNKLASKESIEYIAYFDSSQNLLMSNGNGFVCIDLQNGLVANDPLSYEEGSLINNNRDGIWKGVDGQYRFEEHYKAGELLEGKSYGSDNNVFTYSSDTYDQNPEYPGGVQGIQEHITRNFKLSDEAQRNGVHGHIVISFNVDEKGKVQDIKIKNDLGFGTKEESIKVIRTMDKWKPATRRGIPVKVSFTLPINI